MKNINNINLNIINIIFIMFPLSFIFGNFYINLNVIFLIFFGFIFYKEKIIKFKIDFIDKIVIIFFFYTFITLAINIFEGYLANEIFSKLIISKTFMYLRYLIFYLVLRVLVSQNILRLDWFSKICSIFAIFVCLDIFIQYYFGKDIFGIEPVKALTDGIFIARHYSGLFREEYIAGGYLQKFSLFCFFLPFIIKKKIFYKILIQSSFLLFFIFGIILSGNRMPFFLFILAFFLYLLLDKSLRKHIFIFFIITFLSFILSYKIFPQVSYNMSNFYYNGQKLVKTFFIKDLTEEPFETWNSPYVTEFYCFKYNWKRNPIFGGGIRSFRDTAGCGSHPHNYYFEILTELGVVGLSIILFLVFSILYRYFVNINSTFQSNLNLKNSELNILPFFLVLVVEFFPLRTSGSFFSTGNSTIIFFFLAIFVSFISNKKTL